MYKEHRRYNIFVTWRPMPLTEFAANMFRKQFREAADSADRTEISPAGHVLPPQPALTSEIRKFY
jgi:hypothetical protein